MEIIDQRNVEYGDLKDGEFFTAVGSAFTIADGLFLKITSTHGTFSYSFGHDGDRPCNVSFGAKDLVQRVNVTITIS